MARKKKSRGPKAKPCQICGGSGQGGSEECQECEGSGKARTKKEKRAEHATLKGKNLNACHSCGKKGSLVASTLLCALCNAQTKRCR